jgi:hypothetical protein
MAIVEDWIQVHRRPAAKYAPGARRAMSHRSFLLRSSRLG